MSRFRPVGSNCPSGFGSLSRIHYSGSGKGNNRAAAALFLKAREVRLVKLLSVISLPCSVLAAGLIFSGALSAQQESPAFVEIVDDFTRGSGGWLPSFSDYSLAQGGMDRLA